MAERDREKDTEKDKENIGVLLLNVGGPASLSDVKPFLYNLFSDREIIRLGPLVLQKPMAWLISSLRSKKTEKMYSRIGGKSPILDITMAQAEALEKVLNKGSGFGGQGSSNIALPLASCPLPLSFKVYIGMRYWHPFIKDTVKKIIADGIKYLIVLSLYPHYSKATTGSAISEFKKTVASYKLQVASLRIQYIKHWYDFPPYIDAVAELISEGISEFKGNDVDVLYSAHSLPESFIKEGDLYLEHIKATIREVNKKLSILLHPPLIPPLVRGDTEGLKGGQRGGNHSSLITHHSSLPRWHLSFQSKTGSVKWLSPSTDEIIIRLAKVGSKNLFVVPISFVSDNIETLYEIDILYRELAMKHSLNLKRCQSLNTSERFITALKELVMTKVKESE